MLRRSFIKLSASALAAMGTPQVLRAMQAPSLATLHVGDKTIATMPRDFTGVSIESPQLYNASYFSAANTTLVDAFRKLSRNGILRSGGHLSDVTRWNGLNGDFASDRQARIIEKGKTYWEWKLTDPSVQANKDGAITPKAIDNLKVFLDATDWRLIYGLCFGGGTPERARDEAAYVAKVMGDRLVCFQVGNEDDQFAGMPHFRDRSYNFDTYYAEYQQFVAAVRKSVPNAKFAGPDVAGNMEWVTRFGQRKDNAAIFLSSHFYAMGPAKDPRMDAAFLLATPNPRLQQQIEKVHQITAASNGLGYRMTEGNSCFGGGKPDVSDAFASALWGADYMLECASAGYLGVNLHGGGDGYYTPIAVGPELSTILRPLYFGMQFADAFAGGQLLQTTFETTQNVRAYSARRAGAHMVAIINKSDAPITVSVQADFAKRQPSEVKTLTGPSLSAHENIRFASTPLVSSQAIVVPATSATLVTWKA